MLAMAFDDRNTSAPPPHRRSDNSPPDLPRSAKRFKTQQHDELLAGCLVALARSGGDPSPSAANPPPTAATFDEKRTKLSPSKINAPPQVKLYKCDLCEKAFKSPQALGGHQTSHRKKPPNAVEDNGNTFPVSDTSGPHPTGRIHKCSICKECFPTGQALGGHKRKHYSGKNGNDNDNDNGSSVVTSFSDRGDASYRNDNSGDATRIARNFDLNLPPSSEESEPDLTLKL